MTHTINRVQRVDTLKAAVDSLSLKEKRAELTDFNPFSTNTENIESLTQNAARQIAELLETDECQILLAGFNGQCRCRSFFSKTTAEIYPANKINPKLMEETCNRLLNLPENIHRYLTQAQLSDEEKANLELSPNLFYWIVPVKIKPRDFMLLILGRSFANDPSVFSNDEYYMVDLIADQLVSVIARTQTCERIEPLSIEPLVIFLKTLENRGLHNASHSRQMAVYSEKLAALYHFSARETRELCWAALLHDVGKICVSDSILKKTTTLTSNEWEIIKTHPKIGAQIVGGVSGLEKIAPLIFAHHERVDGKGYPLGLKGDDIPLGSRILSIVDAYTTMISGRPDQAKYTHDEALMELANHSGSAFDPQVLENFFSIFD